MRGATQSSINSFRHIKFQSTRPVRGATFPKALEIIKCKISIHAPRAGRDRIRHIFTITFTDFNPRAPCGARPWTVIQTGADWVFQSTRPVRGATTSKRRRTYAGSYFNPRAPCGARPLAAGAGQGQLDISIHAPRAGRDPRLDVVVPDPADISIHAPRAGRDQPKQSVLFHSAVFQSTRPVRGATISAYPRPTQTPISIHAPRAGRDGNRLSPAVANCISIHAPRAGRDRDRQVGSKGFRDFNPRAPCGARLCKVLRPALFLPISIHAPRAGRDSACLRIKK